MNGCFLHSVNENVVRAACFRMERAGEKLCAELESCLCLTCDLRAMCAQASQEEYVGGKSIASFYFLGHSSASCCPPRAAAAQESVLAAMQQTHSRHNHAQFMRHNPKFNSDEEKTGMSWLILEVIKTLNVHFHIHIHEYKCFVSISCLFILQIFSQMKHFQVTKGKWHH